jgi:exodeoxyribonuclease VII large subunit
MNLFAPRKIYTVSAITAGIKACLESEFSEVSIEGEISNLSAAASGHLYFGLKDKGAQLRCVCFRGKARFLKFRAEDGLQVVASGDLSVYEPRGEYQLIVDFMEPKGFGSLQLAFEQLKARCSPKGFLTLSAAAAAAAALHWHCHPPPAPRFRIFAYSAPSPRELGS